MKLALIIMFAWIFAHAAPDAGSSLLKSKSEKILAAIQKSQIPASDLGIYISTDQNKQVLVDLESDKSMNPASVSKLITAGAVLSYFPPGFNFVTRLTTASPQVGSAIKGDIYLKGTGDPSLNGPALWSMINDVRISGGLREIDGNMIVDDSLFDRYRPTQSQTSSFGQTFEPTTGALSFSTNQITIYVSSGEKVGDPPYVFLDLPNEYVRLQVTAKTVSPSEPDQIEIKQTLDSSGTFESFVVAGKVQKKNKRLRIYRYFWQPDLWAGYALKDFMRVNYIALKGHVLRGPNNDKAERVLAAYKSPPIEDLVATMNKDSNNFYAEMLTQAIASLSEKKASLSSGLEKIKKFYAGLKIPGAKLEMNSPSGLSRHNKLSAKATWQFLNKMQNDHRYSLEFMRALSIGHADGTLKNRFQGETNDHKIRAKSGHLTGVSALAGYGWVENQGYVPFALFYNGKGKEEQASALFDEIVSILVQ